MYSTVRQGGVRQLEIPLRILECNEGRPRRPQPGLFYWVRVNTTHHSFKLKRGRQRNPSLHLVAKLTGLYEDKMVMVLSWARPRSCERETETHDGAVVEEGGDSRGVGQHDTLLEPRSGYTPTPTLTPPLPSQTINNSLVYCSHYTF